MFDSTFASSTGTGKASHSQYIIPFEAAAGEPVSRIGGKCAGLAKLVGASAPVSPGFAVTTEAYFEMMAVDGLGGEIESLLARLDVNDIRNEAHISDEIGATIQRREMPAAVADAIRAAYAGLHSDHSGEASVAVRSSGTGEDLPDASFAGQGDTYLAVTGAGTVLDRVKKCWASLYSARAMSYRAQCGMGQLDVQMAVAVQVMVDAQCAGVAMTLDPTNGDRSKIVVEATWGLGETLVSGEVTPDHFLMDKVMLMPVSRRIGTKDHELVTDPATRSAVRRPVEAARRDQSCVTDEELLAITSAAKSIERYFGCPQDIEWAIDKRRQKCHGLVILQSRPETVWTKKHAGQGPQSHYSAGASGILDTLIAPLTAKK
jgi:pyruvate, water dikinase